MEDQNCSQLAEMCEFDEDCINYREEALKISQDTSSIAHDIHSKLDTLRSEGIETSDRFETPFTGNPDVPTLKYSASPPVLGKAYNILVVGARESEDKAYRVFDEMLKIREFPGSANPIDGEMSAVDKWSDSQRIGSCESAIKHMSFIPPGIADSSLHYQHTTMEPGLMALSIYCAQMAPKWNCLLELRPRQLQDMSVESYYNQFFIWKKKLEEVNYIGDEGSYIDDFLFGLKMDIAVSVWRYKWKPRTLYGAFRSAEISETMISWKKLSLRNDVDKMFEEMSQPNYGHTAESQNAEAVPDERRNVVRKLSELEEENENQLTSKQEDSGLCYLESEEGDDFPHLKADNPLVEMVEQSSPSMPEVIEDAHHMFDEMPHSVPVSLNLDASLFRDEGNDYLSSKIRGLEIVKHMFDGMPKLFFVDQNEIVVALIATEDPDLHDELWFSKMLMFMFDPGISSWHHRGCACIKSNGVKHEFDKMPADSNVEVGIGKVLLLVFDPGGNSWGKYILEVVTVFVEMGKNEMSDSHLLLHLKPDIEFCINKVSMFVFDPGGICQSALKISVAAKVLAAYFTLSMINKAMRWWNEEADAPSWVTLINGEAFEFGCNGSFTEKGGLCAKFFLFFSFSTQGCFQEEGKEDMQHW